ncbi:MAG: hypothetical protein ACPGQQ_02925 [Candidatus Puniceispirillaceae bacterium]
MIENHSHIIVDDGTRLRPLCVVPDLEHVIVNTPDVSCPKCKEIIERARDVQ